MGLDKTVRYKVIVNPAAGQGAGQRALPKVQRLLAEHGLDFDLVPTERPWHAADLAQEAAVEGYDVIVAAGGDGTVNEVINGLMAAKKEVRHLPALGVVGAGRGNDFAHGVGIPAGLEAACQVLARDRRRTVDVGRVVGGLFPQGRFFGNCVGVGFDAIGTIEAARLPRLGGFLSFFVAVLKTIFVYYRAPVTRIDHDDQTLTQPSLMVSIMNGRRLGGGFVMAPGAEPDDGLFDLCIAAEMSRRRIFRLIPHFLKGTQASQKEITTGRAARITITALDGALPAQTDGEILCVDGERLEIELLPRQIEVLCQTPGGTP